MDLMSASLLAARLYLGAIWIVAGAGKLAESPTEALVGGRQGLARFRSAAVVRMLSLAELTLGLALVGGMLLPWGSLASAGLFGLFTATRMAGRRQSECGCFGAFGRGRSLQTGQLLFWTALSGLMAVIYAVRPDVRLDLLVPTAGIAAAIGGILIFYSSGVHERLFKHRGSRIERA